MKNLLKSYLFMALATISLFSCNEESGPDAAEQFVTILSDQGPVTQGFRNTEIELDLFIQASSEINTVTANGNPVSINNDGRGTYTFSIPSDDIVGSEYPIEVVVNTADGSTITRTPVTVQLIPGPALESSSIDALATVFSEFSNISVEALVSSTDVLDTYNSVGGFQLGGSADGMGMVENADGNFELMVNCEDHYSVVRITLDQDLKPLKGDYLLNSSVADFARQCSATMWEADIHGGSQDLFISASETFNYTSRGINPYLETPEPAANYNLPALGQYGWENNVPLPEGAYAGKTVVIGGDDDSGSFAGGAEGQVAMYLSEAGDADLSGGNVYVLRLEGATSSSTEGDLNFGQTYDVEFVEVEGSNVDEYDVASAAANSLQFMRVEDLDYGKGSDEAGRTIYFAVTGRGPGRGTYNDWGTGYKLELDADNPLKGQLTQIVSGNTNTNNMDGNMDLLQSPDNIVVTENYVYWQEDPNSFDRGHQAYIWQTDLDGNNAKAVLQIDINSDLNTTGSSFSGEFGAMIDISDKVGEDGTFLLALQPHYWRDDAYSAIDGHDLGIPPGFPGEDNQGSQVVILRNVPR